MRLVNISSQECDVYIGRPSKWGNPFRSGVHGNRCEVIKKYEQWIRRNPDLINSLHELKNKTLGCHCFPDHCHGEVLIKLVLEFCSYVTIIAGSRTINDYKLVQQAVSASPIKIGKIISGHANEIDLLGERYADEHEIDKKICEPVWRHFDVQTGRLIYDHNAGKKRNVQMARQAEALIAIHDGKSSGTKHMIETAQKYGLITFVYYPSSFSPKPKYTQGKFLE